MAIFIVAGSVIVTAIGATSTSAIGDCYVKRYVNRFGEIVERTVYD